MRIFISLMFGLFLLIQDFTPLNLNFLFNTKKNQSKETSTSLAESSFFRAPVSDCDTDFIEDMIQEKSYLYDKTVGKFMQMNLGSCMEDDKAMKLYFDGMSAILANNIEGWTHECIMKEYDLKKVNDFFNQYKDDSPVATATLESLKAYIDGLIDQQIKLNEAAPEFYAELFGSSMPEITQVDEDNMDKESLGYSQEPGKCFAKCIVADDYDDIEKVVEINFDPSKPLYENPRLFQRITEKEPIVQKSTPFDYSYKDASYEHHTMQILIREQINGLTVIKESDLPEVEEIEIWPKGTLVESINLFETVSEIIEVAPASAKWVKKTASETCLDSNPDDCFVLCMKEIPAQYKTLVKKVIAGFPNSTALEDWVYKDGEFIRKIENESMASNRTYRLPDKLKIGKTIIPAEYKTVQRKRMIAMGSIKKLTYTSGNYTLKSRQLIDLINLDETSDTVSYSTKQLKKKGGLTEWQEILCPQDVNSFTISQIQQALIDKGYELPRFGVDNVLNVETKAALTQFQKDNNLPVGQLDLETLRVLGIEY